MVCKLPGELLSSKNVDVLLFVHQAILIKHHLTQIVTEVQHGISGPNVHLMNHYFRDSNRSTTWDIWTQCPSNESLLQK